MIRFVRAAEDSSRRAGGPVLRRVPYFGASEATISFYQLEQGSFCRKRPLLRRRRGGKLLEARIIPKRIEHWIELEERWGER